MKKGDAMALVIILYILLFIFMLIVFIKINDKSIKLREDIGTEAYFGDVRDMDITLINILRTKVDDRNFAEFLILNKDDKGKTEDKVREIIGKDCIAYEGDNFNLEEYKKFLDARYNSCRYLFKIKVEGKSYVFGTVPVDDEWRTEEIPDKLNKKVSNKNYLFIDKVLLNYPGNIKFTLLYELGREEVKIGI